MGELPRYLDDELHAVAARVNARDRFSDAQDIRDARHNQRVLCWGAGMLGFGMLLGAVGGTLISRQITEADQTPPRSKTPVEHLNDHLSPDNVPLDPEDSQARARRFMEYLNSLADQQAAGSPDAATSAKPLQPTDTSIIIFP